MLFNIPDQPTKNKYRNRKYKCMIEEFLRASPRIALKVFCRSRYGHDATGRKQVYNHAVPRNSVLIMSNPPSLQPVISPMHELVRRRQLVSVLIVL